MDVHDDLVSGSVQADHGFCQNISGGSLNNVFDEFGSIAFQPCPFFLLSDTFIGDGLAAELVKSHLRLHIHQLSAGRQHNEHHAALIYEADTMGFRGGFLLDAGGGGTIHIPPQLGDERVGLSPGIHQRLQFLLRDTHVQCAHGFQCTNATTITKSQLGDLALLTEVSIDTMLLNRDMEHLAGRCTVNVAAISENLLSPLLSGKPCDDSCLDGCEVRHKKAVTGFRNECGTDQLRQHHRHRLIEHLYGFKVTAADQRTDFIQIRQMILRQILHLDQTTGISTSSVRTIELD